MRGTAKYATVILAGLLLVVLPGGLALIHSLDASTPAPGDEIQLPVVLAHSGASPGLERPAVAFNHDRHTAVLGQGKNEDCAVCHVLKETDTRLTSPEVAVFGFPKGARDHTDKASIMHAYHGECVSCHQKKAVEGKKTGPDMGLCGRCHEKEAKVEAFRWAWEPIFDYSRHARHLEAVKKAGPVERLNVAKGVETIGETTGNKCELCHHLYDKERKKLVYKKDSENSCRACHKGKDEANARSMKKVAHSACIGCHMKLAEEVKAELTQQGRTVLTAEDKKRFGPLECRGCHGEHKELKPDERAKLPRLVRGQKDVIDLALPAVEKSDMQKGLSVTTATDVPVRMKAVPFNHKAHEPRAQFCSSCHHHSLEKCANCHSTAGDLKKGGGVSYERAFHRQDANKACVGCHSTAKADAKCAGCHQRTSQTIASTSCPVCHRGPSEGKSLDVAPIPLYQDKEKVPEKLFIKVLEKEFKPAEMPHMKIVNKMVTASNESSLARWFHGAKEQTLCAGCHHRGELQQAAVQAPKCSTCHNRSTDPVALGKPGIGGAYHQQCIGCHTAMGQKPAALECAKCHPEKDGVQKTAGLDPAAELKR